MSLFQELLEPTTLTTSRIYGVVIGLVTNSEDPEKMGRVKVKYPWLSDTDESNWARIATPMAGKERGFFFPPEVDDEVLIAFEQGDTRFPYVVGFLWNGKDTPPVQNDGKSNLRMIKSRSGHIIQFNDEDGRETIEIIDKSSKNKISIDTKNNKISITSEADIELSAPKGKITLDAQTLELKSKAATKIESGSNLDIKASGQLNCKGAIINLN
ncbi:MAG: phage tail protein [Alkalinema sp. RU_4_3]|nr:phage tail protein [Alkalinema sp. RU_4_3]